MRIRNRLIILAMSIGIFLCMLDTTVMNVALPAIQSSLAVHLDKLSWALNIYTILFATLTIPLSKLAERWGINKTYIVGLLIFISGSMISAVAQNLLSLIIGRAGQSIGAAIVFPLSLTIGISSVDLAARKGVIAVLGITQGLASALGPTIGGCVTQFWSWRWIFIINIPLSLFSLLICFLGLTLNETKQKEPLDLWGSLLSMITLFAFTLGLVQGRAWGWHSETIIGLFITALVALILFIICESQSQHPMVPLALFGNQEFTGAAITIVCSNLFLVAVTVILPTYFTKIQNKTELTAAFLITPITGMIFIFSPLAAVFIDQLGARRVLAIGFLLMTGSFWLFSTINMKNLTLVIISCLILGMGYGIITGPITVLAASDFQGTLLNASQSVAGVLRQIGISLAIAIYVSGLYGNLVTARTQATQYIQAEVATLKIPMAKKQLLTHQALQALSHHSSKTTTNYFTAQDKQQIVQAQYIKSLQQHPQDLSPDRQQQLHQHIQIQVEHKLTKINRQINTVIHKIHRFATRQYDQAFAKLYRASVIFVFLSTLSCLLFPAKKVTPEPSRAK